MVYAVYSQLPEILRCPITKGTLRLLLPDEVIRINEKICRGELTYRDGTPIKAELETGFISPNGLFVYPVMEGIIILLENMSIPLSGSGNEADCKLSLRTEKKIVQDFYDQVGWQTKCQDGICTFVDALKWEDLRPVVGEYIHNCHLRVNRYLTGHGRYLLDAGCGPIQYPDYLIYSEGYQYRICMDLSFLALREARRKLGCKGIFILGDIANIPLQDNSVDGAVSLHVIYHVPEDEQVNAVREIYRVLKPEACAVINYSWPKSPLMGLFLFPLAIKKTSQNWIGASKRFIKTILRFKRRHPGKQETGMLKAPYHHSFKPNYFISQFQDMNLKILVWRSVSVIFMRTYIHPRLFGSSILRWFFELEEKNPRLLGRIGQYPLFVIEK